MIAWAQGWVPPGLMEAVAADGYLLSALPAPTCASPHVYILCACISKIFPITQISLYEADNGEEQQKLNKPIALSLGYDYFPCTRSIQQQCKKRKRIISSVYSPKHTSWVYRSDLTVTIYMPTSRHHHLMFHCYWFPCLSPQTLLYKCFSRGRTGWNCGSARSHSFQSHFFSAVVKHGKERKNPKQNINSYTGSQDLESPGLNSIPSRMLREALLRDRIFLIVVLIKP